MMYPGATSFQRELSCERQCGFQASSNDQELPISRFLDHPEFIRPAMLLYLQFSLSLPNADDLLQERGIDFRYEAVRIWWHSFGPIFAAEV